MLTKAQRAMLVAPRRDAQGGVVRHAMSNAGPTNRTAEALCRKGLIEWVPGHVFGGSWRITPAGRALLSQENRG